ncbi:MAG: Glycerate 2-kinase [Candidatus Nomurabacteria bacterium GW2011_GWB1_37_5]|uniref:Glycerate 2-kinase n=1 Tax=Candidatus Nomurabacteria bacterium GW2011_GWB1_37_5 TaxID=1618742 RepID=A0A0G0K433_9BACT|nr:MAG: Glycerate 2-kinase [Candidatus Nomurabacteria bacterium GW2011_GWB1_37_5]
MQNKWIKNFEELAVTPERKNALEIAEAGLQAISTADVVANSVKLEENILIMKGEKFDLSKFKKIKVIGFGKASCDAAQALEKVLGPKISEGAVIGLEAKTCDIIETFAGTHPRPSMQNVEAGSKILQIAENSTEDDLVIVLVSGGGSALLCVNQIECEQGQKLYDSFLKTGKTISELNTVRKHISSLKGGGLAKVLYPATVVSLIFSDVPGDKYEDVASGPTYFDKTTVPEVQTIIDEYELGDFQLVETPKEDKYFEKVHNVILVSNKTAMDAMAEKARDLDLEPNIISTDLYDDIDIALDRILGGRSSKELEVRPQVILAAGEPKLVVTKKGGSGGRNLFMAMKAVKLIDDNSVFIPLASDGLDNCDAAGAIVDKFTREKIEKLGLNLDEYIANFNAYPTFQKSGDMIMTGATGANVSDLFILLRKKI